MKLQALRLFLRVMEQGSLAAAAKSLNMSQSAASRLLAGLGTRPGCGSSTATRMRLVPTMEAPRSLQRHGASCSPSTTCPGRPKGGKRHAGPPADRQHAALRRQPVGASGGALHSRHHPGGRGRRGDRSSPRTRTGGRQLSFDLGIGALPLNNPGIASQPLVSLAGGSRPAAPGTLLPAGNRSAPATLRRRP